MASDENAQQLLEEADRIARVAEQRKAFEKQKEEAFDIPCHYVNFVVASSNPEEVVFQMGQVNPDMPTKVFPVVKISMSRRQVERFSELLLDIVGHKVVDESESGGY